MKSYNIGIIGYGGFGKFLHHWWGKLDRVNVMAIADAKLQDDHSGEYRVYQNGLDLINDPDVEIVSIVTPPALHAGMACAAMRAGKHVLLEKPVAITNEQAEQIKQVQLETGKVVLVNHMIRYNPLIKAIKQLSLAGKLGELRHAVVNNYAQDSLLPIEHWFWNRALSGGILVEHGVHFIDIINALTTQTFTDVSGYWHDRNENQRDQVAALVHYNKGLIASHYHSFSGPGFFERTTIQLMFDLAKIEIEGWMPMKGTLEALVNESSKEQFTILPGWKQDKIVQTNTLNDLSRPEGWGDVAAIDSKIFIAGIQYDVTHIVSGNFEIPKTKGEVYGQCVQGTLLDLIAKTENPNHQTSVTLQDACTSLEIALLASGE